MTTVYYTNVTIPLGGVTVTGSFTVSYDGSGGGQIVAANLQSTSGVVFDSTVNSSFISLVNYAGPGSYQFVLRPPGSTLTVGYRFQNGDGTQIEILPDDGNAQPTYILTSSPFIYGIYSSNAATSTGSLIDPACFLKGTNISTPFGAIPIEDLHIGDLILTSSGHSAPVKWIGKQRFHPKFGKDHLPICITAGALTNGLPHRDLYVSPDHAMFIDNCVLVHAKALVNGTSIYQVTEWNGDVAYFHIETENHEIILAEGAPAETFVDNVSRKAFYNYAEYEALYPDAKPMVELNIPRVKFARQLPMAIRQRLAVKPQGQLVASA